MDIAQTLQEEAARDIQSLLPPASPSSIMTSRSIPSPRIPTAAQMEKRKSSYSERYSQIILPPLQEESTPVQSPAGTLSRGVIQDLNLNGDQHSIGEDVRLLQSGDIVVSFGLSM